MRCVKRHCRARISDAKHLFRVSRGIKENKRFSTTARRTCGVARPSARCRRIVDDVILGRLRRVKKSRDFVFFGPQNIHLQETSNFIFETGLLRLARLPLSRSSSSRGTRWCKVFRKYSIVITRSIYYLRRTYFPSLMN